MFSRKLSLYDHVYSNVSSTSTSNQAEKLNENKDCTFHKIGYCKITCGHKSIGIICRKALVGECSGGLKCKFQHPHPKLISNTLQTILMNVSSTDNSKFLKEHVVKCPIRMIKEECNDIYCNDLNCNKQHFKNSNSSLGALHLQQTLTNTTNSSPKGNGSLEAKLVDCPSTGFEYNLVHNLWSEKKAGKTLVKVQKVWNPKLESIIDKRKQELKHEFMDIDILFHGTSESAIDSIIRNGFDVGLNKRKAYGTGVYFAFDPNTAISYSGQHGSSKLVVCKAYLAKDSSDHKFVQNNNWFVVHNTSGLQPVYVITFT